MSRSGRRRGGSPGPLPGWNLLASGLRPPPGAFRQPPSRQTPRRTRDVRRTLGTLPRQLVIGALCLVLLTGFWVLMLVVGVAGPWIGAMHLLHEGGYVAPSPLAPDMVQPLFHGILWTALGLALLHPVGMNRIGPFIVWLLIAWFGTALFLPMVVSILVILPVHIVVSPVFGVDAIGQWRPVLHAMLAVAGVFWGIKLVVFPGGPYGPREDHYGVSESRHSLSSVFDVALAAFARPKGEDWSDGSDGSGESDGSGGGDSD